MDYRIKDLVAYCRRRGLSGITLAAPFPNSENDVVVISGHDFVVSMIASDPSDELLEKYDGWLGRFYQTNEQWRAPKQLAKVLALGAPLERLNGHRAVSALRHGARRVIAHEGEEFAEQSLIMLLCDRFLNRLGWHGERLVKRRKLSVIYDEIVERRSLIPFVPKQEFSYRSFVSHAPKGSYSATKHRIVMLASTLTHGGAERQLLNTVAGLRDRGYEDITLLIADLYDREGADFFLEPLIKLGVKVEEIDKEPFDADFGLNHDESLSSKENAVIADMNTRLPGAFRHLAIGTYRRLLALRPELVHCWLDYMAIRGGLAAVMAGVPRIILSGRNVNPTRIDSGKENYHDVFRALNRVKSVFFTNNSTAGAEDYADWLGLPAKRFLVLRNGVSASELSHIDDAERSTIRRNLGIPDSAKVVGGMFRLHPQKRPFLWLLAAAELAEMSADFHFLVYGAGPLDEELPKFARQLGIEDRLHLLPPTAKAAAALCAMDVFLLTSRQEGTPNVLLEAQYLGVPVVATDAGGTRETFENGRTGTLVKSSVPTTIAQAVMDISANSEVQQAARTEGPAFVRRVYGMERMIDETLDLYGFPRNVH
jgi:glycosyltransferase involved in cell wall biosynthesis